jgi:ubiquinol-cytochrome c reductase cytochrome b subunit
VIDCLVLGYVGSQPAQEPWTWIGQIAVVYYFVHFLVILPLLGKLERPKPLPKSISEPVLKGSGMSAQAPAKPMEKA